MTAREVRDEVVVVDRHPVLDARVLLVLPAIPEAAPARIREGISRRRIAATSGRCPCGAVVQYGGHEAGAAVRCDVEHAAACPAITETLARRIRRWVR